MLLVIPFCFGNNIANWKSLSFSKLSFGQEMFSNSDKQYTNTTIILQFPTCGNKQHQNH